MGQKKKKYGSSVPFFFPVNASLIPLVHIIEKAAVEVMRTSLGGFMILVVDRQCLCTVEVTTRVAHTLIIFLTFGNECSEGCERVRLKTFYI